MRRTVFLIFGLIVAAEAIADKPITFEWDAHDQETVTGFRLFQRTENGEYDYDKPVARIAGGSTSWHKLENVQPGIWCWVLRAHDDDGNESGDSNEGAATVAPEDEKPRNIRKALQIWIKLHSNCVNTSQIFCKFITCKSKTRIVY